MSGLCNHSLELTGLAGDTASPVHRLDPRAKIVGLIAITLVAVSTPVQAWPVFVACFAVLAGVTYLARVRVNDIWRRARFVLPVVLLAALLIPLFRTGGETYSLGPLTLHQEGLETFAAVTAKATIGTVAAVLLGATTTFPSVLRGLEAMRVPRLFILIAAFMYRYLFVIVEEVGRMRAALAARGYQPRSALHAGVLGRVATALFLRTYSRGERVYVAMLARGYNGRMPRLTPLVFGRARPRVRGRRPQRARAAAGRGRGDRMSCAVHATGVSYSYPNGRPALRGVELHIEHGERVAILGPNGAGKTTLMLHLNGLMRGAGSLEVAGLQVEDGTLAALRTRVGLVFQDPDDQLFMPTVGEDVSFGPLNQGLPPAEVERRVGEALAAVRMSEAGERAPHQLSMGERRRVAIATVLAMRPSLLVLDEPSANLDPRARRELLDILEQIDRTMLLTTHDLPLAAELCERAVILADGRIVADADCHELLADSELLARHDLELPAGFMLERVTRRPRPVGDFAADFQLEEATRR